MMKVRYLGGVLMLGFGGWTGTFTQCSAQLPAAEQVEQDVEQPFNVNAAINKVFTLLQDNKFQEAAELLEQVIKADKANYMAMTLASQVYMNLGVEMAAKDRKAANKPLRRSAELMRAVKAGKKTLNTQEKQLLATGVYNEACCAAVDGDKDQALKLLQEAIDLGFSDLETLEDDADFESIKDNPQFKAIVQDLKDKNAQRLGRDALGADEDTDSEDEI